jgi:hypothetical protein
MGISGFFVSGGKNTTGQFPNSSSLFMLAQSLSYTSTPNLNSPDILGMVKYVNGVFPGVYFISNSLF